MREEWRSVLGEPGYEISNRGRVRSWRGPNGSHRKKPRLRKLASDKDGYLNVLYISDGWYVLRKVHHLVLEAFVGRRRPGQECRHKNGIASDNRLDNLAWGTRAENDADKLRHGTSQHGERNHRSKLTNKEADMIRKSKEPLKVLAARYGVRESTISRIRNGVRRAV